MAYAAPSSRIVGETITADIWNQDVVDNMVHVASMLANGTALSALAASSELQRLTVVTRTSASATASTSSSTFTDLRTILSGYTPTYLNCIVVMAMGVLRQSGGGNGTFRLWKSGGTGTWTQNDTLAIASGNTHYIWMVGTLTGYTNNAKTISLQGKTDGAGTANVDWYNAVAFDF